MKLGPCIGGHWCNEVVGELVESNKDVGRRVVTKMMEIEDKAGL